MSSYCSCKERKRERDETGRVSEEGFEGDGRTRNGKRGRREEGVCVRACAASTQEPTQTGRRKGAVEKTRGGRGDREG